MFNNVPFNTTNALQIYYKQISSDENHEFDNTVQSTTLTTQSQTVDVTNPLAAERTFNLTDANYENLPIESGTITLN